MPTSVDDFFAVRLPMLPARVAHARQTLSSDDIREIRKRNPANLQLAIVKVLISLWARD